MSVLQDEPWLDRFLPAMGEVFVDVGANHGAWSRALAGRFRQVYAVEPNPWPALGLRTLPENVTVLAVAAWEKPAWRTFTHYASDQHLSTFFVQGGIHTGAPQGALLLWCVPLDAMPIAGRVSLVKIDVEGAERAVVLGAERMLRRDRPRLIIEVHSAQQGLMVGGLLGAWGFRCETVRHPLYAEDDALRDEHYWLICDPV